MIRRHSVVYALCVSLVVASSAVAQTQEPEGSWLAIAPGEDVMAAVVSVCARLALPPDVCLQVQEDVVARHKPDEVSWCWLVTARISELTAANRVAHTLWRMSSRIRGLTLPTSRLVVLRTPFG